MLCTVGWLLISISFLASAAAVAATLAASLASSTAFSSSWGDVKHRGVHGGSTPQMDCLQEILLKLMIWGCPILGNPPHCRIVGFSFDSPPVFLTSSHLILPYLVRSVLSQTSVCSDTSAHIISCHLLPRLLMSASSDLILKESPYPRPLFLISSSLLGSSHSISPCLLFLCPDLIFSHLFFCNVGFQYDLQRNFAKHRSSLQ